MSGETVGPRGYDQVVSLLARLRLWWELPRTAAITLSLTREVHTMTTDMSADLNEVADGIDTLRTPVAELLAERDALAAENAELKGEDVRESAAGARVREAFDGLAGLLTNKPDAPDVEPLPDPAEPTSPVDPETDPEASVDPAGEGTDEGTIGAGGAGAENPPA